MTRGVTARIYLISPPAIHPSDFAPLLTAALDAGDVAAFQLRLKEAADEDVIAAGKALLPICRARDVAFIVNDRPDLAKAIGADGVHVGQNAAPLDEARRIMGDKAIIGATCHNSRHLAIEAGEDGADYVAFGAFYPTQTKDAPTSAEPDILDWWSEIFTLPCLAIGGITPENCAPLVEAGADFIAVSSFVWAHEKGPAAAISELNAAITEASA